jgi:ribonuclease H / adenosylcobalamin/alpha-ribazole phosphatase
MGSGGGARRLVVEADGGSRGNPGPAAYGALVRDAATGEVLAETAEYLGRATNNVAEYRGLIAGLRAARAVDPDSGVEVRMDSKLVVEQMSGRWKIKHPDMRPLAAEARAVYPVAGQVTYRWVPRARNAAADRLANEALDAAAAGRVWEPRPATPPGRVVVDDAEAEPAGQGAGTAGAAGAAGTVGTADPAAGGAGWGLPTGVATTFVLLRHGETALTAEKRFSGHGGGDPELSDRGRAQAERAAAILADRGTVDAVVSSPARRARQTAEAAAQRLGLDMRVEEGFREAAFGEWEGYTFAEIQQRWPAELDAWLSATSVAPPGGESFDDVAARTALARDKTIARYAGRTVLVVSHVTPIKTLVRLALDAPPPALYRMELQPASVSVIQWYGDGNASLRLFNDTGHLR